MKVSVGGGQGSGARFFPGRVNIERVELLSQPSRKTDLQDLPPRSSGQMMSLCSYKLKFISEVCSQTGFALRNI